MKRRGININVNFCIVQDIPENFPDIEDLKIYFCYENIIVESIIGTKQNVKCIEIKGYVNKNSKQSLFETGRLIRPLLLIIQGILSLFLDIPITVYEIESTNYFKEVIADEDLKEYVFKVGDRDFTQDLKKVLVKLNESQNRNLSISILDRWRKNLNLENEDIDGHLYRDESLLGLFHILELLSENCAGELKKEANRKIKESLREYGSLMLIRESELEEYVNQNLSIISKSLDSNNPNFATKIKYLLFKNGIISENEMYFVETIVKLRNGIAHGRILFQPVFRWPLTPFFNISKNITEADMLRYLVKKLIGNFFGISSWDEEYAVIARNYLKPPFKKIRDFLAEPDKYKVISANTLKTSIGNELGITWENIFWSYLENHNKIKLDEITIPLKSFFLTLEIDEENIMDIFIISVIFIESRDMEIATQCSTNMDILLTKGLISKSDLLEITTELDFYNINYDKYENFICSKTKR